MFFDYNRIELYDEEHSGGEERYNTIGDVFAANILPNNYAGNTIIGNLSKFGRKANDILFVVYTERVQTESKGKTTDVTRIISARMATSLERGLYYGKFY